LSFKFVDRELPVILVEASAPYRYIEYPSGSLENFQLFFHFVAEVWPLPARLLGELAIGGNLEICCMII
jgi:hypothetical protein